MEHTFFHTSLFFKNSKICRRLKTVPASVFCFLFQKTSSCRKLPFSTHLPVLSKACTAPWACRANSHNFLQLKRPREVGFRHFQLSSFRLHACQVFQAEVRKLGDYFFQP